MIKTLKKFSRKSLAILIALLMIISVMPFTPPISVEAATDTSALSNAISAYENKMDGTIYTNMKDAYNKYILACEAYDAITYGERTDIDANTVASNLSNATTAMTAFSDPVFNTTAYFYKSSMPATDGYSNVVYQSSNPYTAFGYQGTDTWQETGRIRLKVALPYEMVLVYDGVNSVYSPATVQATNSGASACTGGYNREKRLRYIALTSDSNNGYTKLELKQNWNMEAVNLTWKSPLNNNNPVPYQYSETNHGISFAGSGDNNHTITNRLYFTSVKPEGNTNTYYDKFSGEQIKFTIAAYRYSTNLFGSVKENNVDTNNYYASGTQYVINYRPIKTKLSSAKTNLTNALNGKTVSSYKEGGLGSLLDLIDKCTADNVDPTKCAYSSGVETAVTTCANNIKKVNAISVPDVTEDLNQTTYGNLKTEIVEYNTIIANNTYKNHQLSDYTDDSIAKATTALNEAKDFMKTVYTNGYADSSTATSKYNAMVTAKEGLTLKSYKVTFKYANDSIADEKVYTIGTLASNITKPNNTASNYDNAKHYSYSWPDLANVTADATYNELKSEAEHSFTSTVTKESTCTTAGETTYTCACGYSYKNNTTPAATGHSWREDAKVPATCTTTGTNAGKTCTVCGATEGYGEIPATGHTNGSPVQENVQDSTCTATGSYDEVVYCSVCGAEISRTKKTIEMKAHTWGDWVYDANKQEKRSCKVCGTFDSEKRNCVYEEKSVTPATCSAVGKRVYRCTQCNNEYEEILPIDSEAHNIATKVETTNATCTVAGKKETVTYCTLCNKEISRVKTEDIPALGHDYIYTSIDSVSHSVICSRNCNEEGWSYTEKHNIKNGECTKCDYVAKVTITFKNADGTVISSEEYAVGTAVTIPALPETEKNDNGDGTHTVVTYAWDDEPQTTAQTEATYTVTSLSNKVNCSFELTQPDIEDGDKTKDKFTCSVCGGVMYKEVADKTALNAAIVALQNDLDLPEAEYKYDAARVEAAQALINEANAIDRYAEQSVVNAKAEAIATAKTELNAEQNLAKYTITVEVVNSENAEDKEVSKYGIVLENQPYGKTFEHSFVFDKIDDGTSMTGLPKYAVYKWMVGDVKLNTTDTSISGVVKGNATYICYVLNFKATNETQNTTRVRYLDKSGKTIDFDTAIVGKKYTIKEGVTAPSIPYYEFSGWDCVFGDETNVGTRELVYKATYTYSDSKANVCEIVGLGGVKVNGAERCSAIYDSKVVLTGATKYAFCDSTGKIISYINNDYIYTPHINNETVYITAVVDEATTATTAITGNFVQKNVGTLNDGRTYHNLYVNAQFYLPEDATAVEAGLVLSKSKSSEEDLQIGKQNVTKLVSTSQSSNHEYSMAMSFANDGTVHARSYLIYVDKSGTTHTVYSAVKTIDYKA